MSKRFWVMLIALSIILSGSFLEDIIGKENLQAIIKVAWIVATIALLVDIYLRARQGETGGSHTIFKYEHPFLFWFDVTISVVLCLVFLYLILI